jgi:transcriptional regulator with XRE-family HTH domain
MPEAFQIKTVPKTVASNVRAFRQLRGIDQAVLARRMEALGIAWRQVTVSEVERDQRNVTVAELLALTLALDTTIEQLLDPRGPERIRGPRLALWESPLDMPTYDDQDPNAEAIQTISPQNMTGLVCTHGDHPVVEWNDENGAVKSVSWATGQPR